MRTYITSGGSQRLILGETINASGQWVERSEHVNLNELFERMSREEMEAYAKDGLLPPMVRAGRGRNRF